MRNERKGKVLLGGLLVVLYLFYALSTSLFVHTHHMPWGDETHSHPYTQGSSQHSHTQGEFNLLASIYHQHYTSGVVCAFVAAIATLLVVFLIPRASHLSRLFRPITLGRAPPTLLLF